jgi:hypothetical protein
MRKMSLFIFMVVLVSEFESGGSRIGLGAVAHGAADEDRWPG